MVYNKILQKDATFKDFYEFINNSYNCNNHVNKIEVKMYDGTTPIMLSFTSLEGFVAKQSERKGTIESIAELDDKK